MSKEMRAIVEAAESLVGRRGDFLPGIETVSAKTVLVNPPRLGMGSP
jgi:hypothetical protein